MTTPARKQYLDIKERHQDAILLYQIGDFFETFDEDAAIAARELNIVLTCRSYGPSEQVPLAGVPVHALDSYAAKLVALGYKVAICEQVSPPGRGLVRREVTRVLTPGTLTDPGLTPPLRDNYLAAVVFARDTCGKITGAGFAYAEVSAGSFACAQWTGEDAADALRAEMQRVSPAEVLLAEAPRSAEEVNDGLGWPEGVTITHCPAHTFDYEDARARLLNQFQIRTLAAFGCENLPLATAAAGAITAYLARMNPGALRLLTELVTFDSSEFVQIDYRTWRALEVTDAAHRVTPGEGRDADGPRVLLDVLDQTRTAMGTRMLRRLLRQPLKDRQTLERRLDAVDALVADGSLRQRLSVALSGMPDVERLVARIAHGSATARDLHSLRSCLLLAPDVRRLLRHSRPEALAEVAQQLDPCLSACELIENAVADPWRGEERVIRPGFAPALDELTREVAEARTWIAELESTERQRTGVKSLKVTYNAVFGYAIEVTRPNLDRVPPEYQRKQTLAHAERFVTAGLLDHERVILRAEERIVALEQSLFADVLARLALSQIAMRRTARALAQLDVWLALAEVAVTRRYVRPTLTDETELVIRGGRHPVVEATLPDGTYIANDTTLGELNDGAGARLALLTGPNMAGKSTYLRQVALIALMAQIGSFVPAQSVRIGLVDRIFTRVGAEDDLAAGLSTFMLEMVETAYILRHATEHSLVILDEIGRGTSTHDGLAIARAVIEHIHTDLRARTLFATHYHELAALSDQFADIALWHLAVVEDDDERPIFLHRLESGPSERSYGVHVASMAGLPPGVVRRARDLLVERPRHLRELPDSYQTARLEERHALFGAPARHMELAGGDRELALALAGLNLAATTPIEALNILFSLQQRALSGLRAGGR